MTVGTAPVPHRPTPDRTVLAVIDMQRVFGDEGSPWLAPRFAEVVPAVRRLVQAHRERGDDVVFTRFVAPEEPTGSWRPYYDVWRFALQPPQAPLWQVVDDLADLVDRTVEATTFSKWDQLAEAVGPQGRLVLCGVSTDCCVLSTALAAADAGAQVVVAADACAGVDDESHAKALHVMGLYAPLVEVVGTQELLAAGGEQAHRA